MLKPKEQNHKDTNTPVFAHTHYLWRTHLKNYFQNNNKLKYRPTPHKHNDNTQPTTTTDKQMNIHKQKLEKPWNRHKKQSHDAHIHEYRHAHPLIYKNQTSNEYVQ